MMVEKEVMVTKYMVGRRKRVGDCRQNWHAYPYSGEMGHNAQCRRESWLAMWQYWSRIISGKFKVLGYSGVCIIEPNLDLMAANVRYMTRPMVKKMTNDFFNFK